MTSIAELYQKHQGTIHHEVSKFHTRTHAHPDDLLSDAHEAFCETYRDWRPSLAAFDTYLVHRLRGKLSEQSRQIARQRERICYSGDLPDVPERAAFDISAFLLHLSDDGRTMAEAAMLTPDEVVLNAELQSHTGLDALRRGLFTFFRDKGWSKSRIIAAFNEVREELRG